MNIALPLRLCFVVILSLMLSSAESVSLHRGAFGLQAEEPEHLHTNRLIDETSPYLLQHAHNPVDWHPWGDEAFEKAKREGKPIFLSVGYSTCYWCHVMEVESFEDPEVAAVINKYFVPVKVDREERPDIDEQYMLATQMMTGRGGWPNSVWLRPDGKPWMAGTYFPKKRFILVLEQIHDFWVNRRPDVDRQAEALAKATREAVSPPADTAGTPSPLSVDLVDAVTVALLEQFDQRNGGFGGAPKFPPHGTLSLLVDRYRATGDQRLLQPITRTLDAMWLGGMHDHLGGGFHRYATDADWLLPHFEKMLYDNAQLMRLYADGHALTGHQRYRAAAADIHGWLTREMTDPAGGFYSALDSGEVGKEGEAYVWSVDQLKKTLATDDARLFAEVYQFSPEGNYLEEATGEKTGKNIPHLNRDLQAESKQRKVDASDFGKQLAKLRERMLKERSSWPQPHCDDKILVSWNGLMIEGLAHAGRVLERPEYIESATRAAEFILDQMVLEGRLQRTYRDGKAKLPAYLDDHVFFAKGLIELYRATGESRWLDQAARWMDVVLDEFQDPIGGGFFFTGSGHEDLIARSKHLGGGGNLPNTNGYAAQVLIALHELTGEEKYLAAAQKTLQSLSGFMASRPHTSEDLAIALAHLPENGADNTDGNADGNDVPGVRRVGPLLIRVSTLPKTFRPGDQLDVTVELQIDSGWHLYAPANEKGPFSPTTVVVNAGDWGTVGKMVLPEATEKRDPVVKQTIGTYSGKVRFEVPVSVNGKIDSESVSLTVMVESQACDDRRCLRPEKTMIRLTLSSSGEETRVD